MSKNKQNYCVLYPDLELRVVSAPAGVEDSSGHALNADCRRLVPTISAGEASPATAGFGPGLCWLEANLDISFHAFFIDGETETQRGVASGLRWAPLVH